MFIVVKHRNAYLKAIEKRVGGEGSVHVGERYLYKDSTSTNRKGSRANEKGAGAAILDTRFEAMQHHWQLQRMAQVKKGDVGN